MCFCERSSAFWNVHSIMCVAKLLLSRTMNKLFYVWFIQEILRKYAEAIFFLWDSYEIYY